MSPEFCEICGQLAQGSHFGVISCRACAAFFRRTADSKWSKMECLSRNCTRENYRCKPCRLKRCREVGMTTSNFQHHRDPIIPRKRKLPPAFEEFIGRPHIVIFCDSDTHGSGKTFINVNSLISRAQKIMETGCESPLISRSHLGKLCYAFRSFNGMKPKFQPAITRKETSELWEFYLLTTARWLTYFQPFQELEDSMKIQLVLGTWHVWSRLHKLIATALYRTRNRNAKSTERITGDGLLTDISKPKTDVEWMSRFPEGQVSYFLEGMRGNDIGPVIDNLKELGLSEMELTFMMAQLCFQYASGRFGGKVSEVMDRFQDILANDLHSYYTEERNPRYAGRLAKMLKINNDIQENIRKHRERAHIAKAFGIFNLDFSHPEMFKDTPIN